MNISSFRNCDIGHKEIVIDVEENICVDYLGRPLDIFGMLICFLSFIASNIDKCFF